MKRLDVIRTALVGSAAGLIASVPAGVLEASADTAPAAPPAKSFWPDGVRLPISLSLMFESGSQPALNPPTPFGNFTPPKGVYDMPTISWYRYGAAEGIERALDMYDKLGVKMTSHMSGLSVQTYPAIAREIVRRGHEAAAHGWDWSQEAAMTQPEELAFIKRNVDEIRRVTGQTPVGYNAPGLRGTKDILQNLNRLGFLYHIDDVSRDEPFIVEISPTRSIVVVPYAVYLNDIRAYEARNFSSDAFLSELKRAFDQLYDEAAVRKRMMAVTMHDRLQRPEHVNAMSEFIKYTQTKPGVAYMKKIDIAKITRADKSSIREKIGDVYPVIPGLYR
jgi:peptidoglycan/xylan/chitin deacetylase (PgdA/CDA1 family)